MKKEIPFTKERLREIFDYINGKLVWKEKRRGIICGNVAGYENKLTKKDSQWVITINYEKYKRSRLVYIYHNGSFLTEFEVSHINGNPIDDRIENLRLVKDASCLLRKNVKGVSHLSPRYKIKPYKAYSFDGQYMFFKSTEEAKEWRSNEIDKRIKEQSMGMEE